MSDEQTLREWQLDAKLNELVALTLEIKNRTIPTSGRPDKLNPEQLRKLRTARREIEYVVEETS